MVNGVGGGAAGLGGALNGAVAVTPSGKGANKFGPMDAYITSSRKERTKMIARVLEETPLAKIIGIKYCCDQASMFESKMRAASGIDDFEAAGKSHLSASAFPW